METIKLLLIGPKWSGKTTLANRLCYGTFGCTSRSSVDRFATTVKTAISTTQLMIYDTNASILEQLVEQEFVKFIDAAVCVHDAQIEDQPETLKLFDAYAHQICPHALVFTVFTKTDISTREFAKEDLFCSAATGFNVQQVFSKIATQVQREKLIRAREQSVVEVKKASEEIQEHQNEPLEEQGECDEEESEADKQCELMQQIIERLDKYDQKFDQLE